MFVGVEILHGIAVWKALCLFIFHAGCGAGPVLCFLRFIVAHLTSRGSTIHPSSLPFAV